MGTETNVRVAVITGASSCIGAGLAVRGEEVRSAGPSVDAWLRRTDLLDGRSRTGD